MFGLIRKKELKHVLDLFERVEKHDLHEGTDDFEKERIWLCGSMDIIYGIAGCFGIELDSQKEGKQDGTD